MEQPPTLLSCLFAIDVGRNSFIYGKLLVINAREIAKSSMQIELEENKSKMLEKISGWKCDKCGKRHFHSKDEHRVEDQILNDLEMNPRCHCGYREVRGLLIRGELRLRAY